MIKVCLISLYEDISSNGIRYLSSYLKSNGVAVNMIFMPADISDFCYKGKNDTKKEINILKNLLNQLSPDLIGIGVMANYFNRAVRITTEIKKDFDISVIYGGIHATMCPEECLEYADIVCVGEAEETMTELCKSKNNPDALRDIKGIYYKLGDKVKKNEIRPLEEDLDKYPFPDYSLTGDFLILNNKLERIQKNHMESLLPLHPFGVVTYRLMSSRGCPFSCTYCCNEALRQIYSGKGKYLRERSVKNVINEMLTVKNKFNIQAFRIMDDSFLHHSLEWFKEFNKLYKSSVNSPFSCLSSPGNVTVEKMKLLVDSGLRHIQIGLQSGSDRINFELYKRKISSEKTLAVLNIINSLNPKPKVDLDIIFDNPFESDLDKIQTIYFLCKINKMQNVLLACYSLVFYPKTQIYYKAIEEGIIHEKDRKKAYTQDFRKIKNTFLNNLCLGASLYKFSPKSVNFFLKYKVLYFPFLIAQKAISFIKKLLSFSRNVRRRKSKKLPLLSSTLITKTIFLDSKLEKT
ncbi:MAG: hypothetical protein COS99_03425 [Candidatus Omnitrophica bacterium CG07_land_8_20_14_0_80_42_15]|uniref:Uncharacterized protein n=1 Tax=Candidatus Aquitaenariimonas noxiae TaxID=1974741 RepID=A0A2J0KTV1_9BACT|nr:MAG: hypothetical protein COS99_03425 [Candidatus Omnitrophica bacterium CG07_land_8_20_14_0_80_42_15]